MALGDSHGRRMPRNLGFRIRASLGLVVQRLGLRRAKGSECFVVASVCDAASSHSDTQPKQSSWLRKRIRNAWHGNQIWPFAGSISLTSRGYISGLPLNITSDVKMQYSKMRKNLRNKSSDKWSFATVLESLRVIGNDVCILNSCEFLMGIDWFAIWKVTGKYSFASFAFAW